ncbi:MAG: Rv1355c family protein, partial [Bacteroidota bacterium]
MIREKSLKDTLSEAAMRNLKTWKPQIFDPLKDESILINLIEEHKPFITDDIHSQLEELVKCRNPKRTLSSSEKTELVKEHLTGLDPYFYGVWVYYEWSNRLVHLLPENEFIEVRTNRNHYKISPAEEEVLSSKKVGLIGLSVGQSVAVTMAMERGFGELRLADFDSLELTNLNRIRTGVHNLGLSKVISVAREIVEIDPFLNITCFTDGLTEDNLSDFFHKGGDLDLLIDECDGLDMKIIARWKAREMKIPVVMEASDRGMVDVERFDLEPERPLLHGMVEDLSPEKLKTLETNEDKIPYMLAIVGADTISTRAKASMLEIGETITTWPQLASAVTLGGGITADVVRRIFLDHYHESGRYYVDVEEIIGNKNVPDAQRTEVHSPTPNQDFGELPTANSKVKIPDHSLEEIINSACHAPSGGNLQPWKWTSSGNVLQLKFDRNLVSSFLDQDNIASMIALGASLENASLEANIQGYEAKTSYYENDPNDLIARVYLEENELKNELDNWLGENIRQRETNRNLESGEALTVSHQEILAETVRKNGSNLLIIEPGETYEKISSLIAATEKFRIMHPEGHRNFIEEMRWSKEEARRTKDGIDINTCDLTIGELTGFKLAREKAVIEKLTDWNGGSAFEKLSKKSTASAAALAIITRPQRSRLDYLKAGRDMERVWIGANALGIGFQPQSPISLLLPRLKNGNGLSGNEYETFNAIGTEFNTLISFLSTQ